ncbi:hypothetical protein PILCRDRAFT_809973 [Piloderma croceum F 1598]|uniref:Uncharacterized protein n=1 Tax=Piloderma croceum (strain F 1598) TaxID=765440 RepID=A0A0C3GN64_PILCF|nr:hypothetical protein PILCRDRAFT_809973 [Piloderma croceum F 1598]
MMSGMSTYCHDIGPIKLDITRIQAADLALPSKALSPFQHNLGFDGVIESCVLFVALCHGVAILLLRANKQTKESLSTLTAEHDPLAFALWCHYSAIGMHKSVSDSSVSASRCR